jgi:hypothetical protein
MGGASGKTAAREGMEHGAVWNWEETEMRKIRKLGRERSLE